MWEGMQLGCYESELFLHVIRGVFIPPILLKRFLKRKRTERNGDKHTWICPIETLVWNCWTNDYTLDQLDAGKSVQGSIECVTICPWKFEYHVVAVTYRCYIELGKWNMNGSHPICCNRNNAMLMKKKELSSVILNGTNRHWCRCVFVRVCMWGMCNRNVNSWDLCC
jgi:hypothetical protein